MVMKNIFILAGLSAVAWVLVSAQQFLFPSPPAEYEVVYLGSPNCGVCEHWKSNLLPAWKRDPASEHLNLEIAKLKGHPFRGGYGEHDPVFREAIGSRRIIHYPSFVLYSRGKLKRVYTGVKGWNRIEKRVRDEANRWRGRAPKAGVQSAV